tara:strand:- start:3943 stop:4521 length:579 start_codon:yes stop_codon:yes gene_type:complete
MNFIEITGQPCAGKTSFISGGILGDKEFKSYKQGNLIKTLNFFRGVLYLDLSRLQILLTWSFKEEVSFFFKLNIFRNAVSKFGVFSFLGNKSQNFSTLVLVDEGLSHLPFLFLNTDTETILNLLREELEKIQVIILKSPNYEVIQERLKSRGHKRLKFLPLSEFIKKNNKIEDLLLSRYSELCQGLKVLEYE